MPAKSNIASLSAYFAFLSHFLILISVVYIMPHNMSFFDSLRGILLLIICWAPLLLVLCVCLFYCILLNPPRYLEARKYLYANALMMMISLSILFNIKQILLYINIYIVGVMLIIIILISTVISIKINRILCKNGFNFNKEINDLLNVGKELKKLSFSKHLSKLNVSMYLFVIPFCIQPEYSIFILMTLAIAVFDFSRVLKIKDAFREYYSIHKTDTNIIVVNYCISVTLAIIFYNYIRFFSLVLFFSSFLMIYIITSRIARYYYKLLEEKRMGKIIYECNYKR